MNLQNRKHIYLFFGCVAAIGFAAGVLFGGEFNFAPLSEIAHSSTGFLLNELFLNFARLEKYLILIFLAGFTVFAPVINFLISIYLGAAAGRETFLLWQSRESIILYIAQGLVIASAAALYLDMCEKSMFHRISLRSPAPAAKSILANSETRRYIIYFCGATLIMALISSALYLFRII